MISEERIIELALISQIETLALYVRCHKEMTSDTEELLKDITLLHIKLNKLKQDRING